MSETAKRDTAEMRYLVGDLAEDEKTRMEEAFFADDSKFEAVSLAEDELIDAYVRNELSPEELRGFQARLVSSERLKERVHFARALGETATSFLKSTADGAIGPAVSRSSAQPKSRVRWFGGLFAQQPALGIALAACAVLILVAGVVLISRLRSESARLEAERAAVQKQKEDSDKRSQEQQVRAQLDAEKRARDQRVEDLKLPDDSQPTDKPKETKTRQPALSKFATVFLTPGSLRSGGSRSTLTIGPATTTARIQLALEKTDYPTYIATIKSADGDEVFRKPRLKPHNTSSGSILLLSLTSKRLVRGAYIVHVDGLTASGLVESVSYYTLQVVRKSH